MQREVIPICLLFVFLHSPSCPHRAPGPPASSVKGLRCAPINANFGALDSADGQTLCTRQEGHLFLMHRLRVASREQKKNQKEKQDERNDEYKYRKRNTVSGFLGERNSTRQNL